MGADLTDKIREDTRKMPFPKEQIALSLVSIAVGFVHGQAVANGYDIGGQERTLLLVGPPALEGTAGLLGYGFSGVSAKRSYEFLERNNRISKGASKRSGCTGFIMGFMSGGLGNGVGMGIGYLYGLLSEA